MGQPALGKKEAGGRATGPGHLPSGALRLGALPPSLCPTWARGKGGRLQPWDSALRGQRPRSCTSVPCPSWASGQEERFPCPCGGGCRVSMPRVQALWPGPRWNMALPPLCGGCAVRSAQARGPPGPSTHYLVYHSLPPLDGGCPRLWTLIWITSVILWLIHVCGLGIPPCPSGIN